MRIALSTGISTSTYNLLTVSVLNMTTVELCGYNIKCEDGKTAYSSATVNYVARLYEAAGP